MGFAARINRLIPLEAPKERAETAGFRSPSTIAARRFYCASPMDRLLSWCSFQSVLSRRTRSGRCLISPPIDAVACGVDAAHGKPLPDLFEVTTASCGIAFASAARTAPPATLARRRFPPVSEDQIGWLQDRFGHDLRLSKSVGSEKTATHPAPRRDRRSDVFSPATSGGQLRDGTAGAVGRSQTTFLYLVVHGFWAVLVVSLLQAAMLAPLVPLADALSLAHARPQQNTAGFEYGWVRGVGSAAFVAGTLLAGHAAGGYGLTAIMWLSATALLAIPFAAKFVPAFPDREGVGPQHHERLEHPWLTLLRQRAFARVTLIAALVLGSHAMYDSFAVIRWREAGISPGSIGLLWSESVAAEVLVFLLIGTTLLKVLKPIGAFGLAASCGLVRWGVMAQTTEVTALALVQPLHGFTFALLHLASMRLITDTVPSGLAGTAQAVYGLVGVGGATAVLIVVSGWLYGRFGPAGFWAMALLCIAAFPVIWTLHRELSALLLVRQGPR
jgi:MFS transporter, PPP family, 3-phenylpropionic acid transporter